MRLRLLLTAGLALTLAGCGGGGEDTAPAPPERAPRAQTAPRPDPQRHRRPDPQRHRPPAPRCDPGAVNCAAASGRILALESRDPDGDGDLHVVVAGGSVTLPGVTVLDISRRLRPRHDPRIGDWAAGAGPVYTGSLGQRQIEVERVVLFPRRR